MTEDFDYFVLEVKGDEKLQGILEHLPVDELDSSIEPMDNGEVLFRAAGFLFRGKIVKTVGTDMVVEKEDKAEKKLGFEAKRIVLTEYVNKLEPGC